MSSKAFEGSNIITSTNTNYIIFFLAFMGKILINSQQKQH
jgi:hypothetical protein